MQTDICRHRHKGAEASRRAYRLILKYQERLQKRIYNYLLRVPNGLTVEEISTRLKLRYTTVSARVSELKAKALLCDSGDYRSTTSGNDAAVVVVVDRRRRVA